MTTRKYQAGQFNTLVRIERLDVGQDALGAPLRTWNLFATWWARVNPLTGSEAYAAQQIQAKAQISLEGPFIAGVTAAMRINDHGAFYDIVSPPLEFDDHSAKYMTILAKSGLNNG
jgi:SPP1 family predicted phage head-tail adaptor